MSSLDRPPTGSGCTALSQIPSLGRVQFRTVHPCGLGVPRRHPMPSRVLCPEFGTRQHALTVAEVCAVPEQVPWTAKQWRDVVSTGTVFCQAGCGAGNAYKRRPLPPPGFRHCRYTIRVIGAGWRRPYTGIPPSLCTESPFPTDRIAGCGRRLNEASRRRRSSGAGRRHGAAALTAARGEQQNNNECADSAGGANAAPNLIEVR
jgi:hypothetical protein